MEHRIEIKDLTFQYSEKPLLNATSAIFNNSSLNGLFGPNGSGKSTLIKLLLGGLKPIAGNILVNNQDICDLSRKDIAKQIAYVPQSVHMEYDFSVEDVVMMGRYPYIGQLSDPGFEDRRLVEEALAETGLKDLRHQSVTRLSGGELQRVMIARALAQDTNIILLDEPISHLDLHYQKEIIHLLKRVNKEKEKLIVVILHDLNIGLKHCDQAYLMDDGKLMSGVPNHVFTKEVIEKVYKTDVDLVKVKDYYQIHW